MFRLAPFFVVFWSFLFLPVSRIYWLRSVADAKPQSSTDNFSLLVYDLASKKVVLQTAPEKLVVPASLLKLMLLYIAFDDMASGKISMEDKVKISKNAVLQPKSKIGFVSDQEVPLKDLLLAIGVASANDAAYAVAEFMGGGNVCDFVGRMNSYAKRIGMKNTFFVNPTGLNASYCERGAVQKNEKDQSLIRGSLGKTINVTTPDDMLKLTVEILEKFPNMVSFINKPEFEFGGKIYPITNNVSKRAPNARGIKTGFTNISGYNIIGHLADEKGEMVAVVTGVKNESLRDLCLEYLLVYAANLRKNDARLDSGSDVKAKYLRRNGHKTAEAEAISPVAFCRGHGRVPFDSLVRDIGANKGDGKSPAS